MSLSPISNMVKVYYSESGKLNVVKGAISERLRLKDPFVRKFSTLKSYGTLVAMPYFPGSPAFRRFPNAKQDGADFQSEGPTSHVTVIEWAVPKVFI